MLALLGVGGATGWTGCVVGGKRLESLELFLVRVPLRSAAKLLSSGKGMNDESFGAVKSSIEPKSNTGSVDMSNSGTLAGKGEITDAISASKSVEPVVGVGAAGIEGCTIVANMSL